METPRSQDQGQTEEAYLKSYESQNRKRKVLILVVAVVAILFVLAAFVGTLGSLGKMNEDVQGAFIEDGGSPSESGAAEGPETNATSAPGESPTPSPTDTTPSPSESAPAPSEPSPNPAP